MKKSFITVATNDINVANQVITSLIKRKKAQHSIDRVTPNSIRFLVTY